MKHNYCVACGSINELHDHHLIPRSIGGSDNESNLITLCNSCHGKIHGITKEWSISELSKASLQNKKAKGERTGSIPYGFKLSIDGVKLLKDDAEQAIIVLCKELKEQGLSLRKIAAKLTEKGFKNRIGNAFNAQTVSNILGNEVIKSETKVKRKRVKFFSLNRGLDSIEQELSDTVTSHE